jgi:hypothetical protein
MSAAVSASMLWGSDLYRVYWSILTTYSGCCRRNIQSSAAVIVLISFGNLVSGSAGVNGVVLATSSLIQVSDLADVHPDSPVRCHKPHFHTAVGDHRGCACFNDSNIIYSMLGVVLAGRRFGIWPYSTQHLKITLVGIAALTAGYLHSADFPCF